VRESVLRIGSKRLLNPDPFFRMPRELLLLRHAKSDWDAKSPSDFDRPLAKRGKKDAPRVGEWLYREGLVPDLVVSSPAERARQTAVKVCKSMDFKKKKIAWDEEIYDADVPALLAVLARCPEQAATVLLIGHNPGLEELLRYLAGDEVESPSDGKLLPTATLARLEMPNDWSNLEPGCAQLVNICRPRKPS
jgi:phosphohistidine phosphatase